MTQPLPQQGNENKGSPCSLKVKFLLLNNPKNAPPRGCGDVSVGKGDYQASLAIRVQPPKPT